MADNYDITAKPPITKMIRVKAKVISVEEKDLKPIKKICKQCKQEYTKEEIECGHCFNCGEHILESF